MTHSPNWPENPPPADPADPMADTALLRAVFAATRDCIQVLDLDGNMLFMNQTGRKLMDISDSDALCGLPWSHFWPDENAAGALAAAQAGKTARFTAARDGVVGNGRVWEVEINPVPGAEGQPQRLLAIGRDITEQHRAQAALLEHNFEHNHRIKNQMAVVQSIVNQTLRGAYPLEQAKKMIAARLDVLARTHDVLMHSDGERAPLSALVATGTQMLDIRRMKVEGPELVIGPKAALSLALILHELAINAATHGAFSVPSGKVQIHWGLAEMDGEPAFELRFTESGGPPVSPPTTRGFGSRLLQGGLSGCASRAWLDYQPEGLQFRLLANLASAQSDD